MTTLTNPNYPTKRRSRFLLEPLLGGSAQLAIHVILIIIGIVYVFPFIWTLGSAFKTSTEFFSLGLTPFPAGGWQVSNFVKAWEGAKFSRYFLNTVFVSVMTTFFVVIITSMAAFGLARLKIPGKNLVLGAIALTFFLPRGYTILPVFQIVKGLGLLNTLWAIILTGTAGNLLINTLLFYGYMQAVPSEIEEAAVMDGATVLQRYLRVVLPLTGPVMATVSLFTFMNSWNDFFTPLVFTLGRPELQTLAVGIYSFVGDTSRDWTALCAAATISIVPVVLVFLVLQRYFIEGFAGAVKS